MGCVMVPSLGDAKGVWLGAQVSSIHLQIIQGMTLSVLWRVLKAHGCKVEPRFWGRLAYLVGCGTGNSIHRALEQAANRLLILRSSFEKPPLFILGHWRSGTTLLHNLLSQDPRLAAPTHYQCAFPHHFVFSQPNGLKLAQPLTPATRPMDNMALSMETPQEDEFALAALCGVSPYLAVLFPRTPQESISALDLASLSPKERRRWEQALSYFLKALATGKGAAKRALLKSPTHTARVAGILHLMPHAKFVHIVRDPYAVFLSSRGLWQRGMIHSHLQTPDPEVVDEYILSTYMEMFRLYMRDRQLIPRGSLCEIRFEGLTRDPLGCLCEVYEQLGLHDFDRMQPRLTDYLATIEGYQNNSLCLQPHDQARVAERWHESFKAWGYPLDPPPDAEYLAP